jgi:sulfite reductase alpha subunit-like flavoprotein
VENHPQKKATEGSSKVLSEEFKPRKRWIDYKAEKIFGNMELKVKTTKQDLKNIKLKRIDPEVRRLEYEIAELEFRLKQAENRIRAGRFPELIPRDKKLVEELKERIAVLKGQLAKKVGV